MNNFETISRALSQNNADINKLKTKTDKFDTSKEDSFIVLNTDALAGLELPENVTYPEISGDILLGLFGFDNILTLYSAIPNFNNKIFVLKPALESFNVGTNSYTITNCAPCIGTVIPYGTAKILMLSFLFNTNRSQMGIMTLYVDGLSSDNVRGRMGIEEIPDGLATKMSSIEENYVKKETLSGYTTASEHTDLSNRVTVVENYAAPDIRNNVLWVGTSIPAGDIQFSNNGTTQSTTSDLGSNNYPKMVADALGFNLYNNSRGASFVCFYPSSEDGTANWAGKDWTEYQNEVHKGYSLSASMAQVEAKFGPNGLNIPEWLLNNFKSYSYESLIIPYIDGTIASCDTVIIDHGYNDRQQILSETSWHIGEGEEMVIGSGRDWLLTLQDPLEKTLTAEAFFQKCWWSDENAEDTKKYYWKAMVFLCKKIWAVNPRIKIIIGNYFAIKSNIFAGEYGNDRLGEFICLANTALANWLRCQCVEVHKYTGLYNRNVAAGNDYQIFCPDNVHPHSDSTGHSNKIIAGIYINALRGILYI